MENTPLALKAEKQCNHKADICGFKNWHEWYAKKEVEAKFYMLGISDSVTLTHTREEIKGY